MPFLTQGGAVVADACNRIQAQVADVTGVAVIDVVEGPCLLSSTCHLPQLTSSLPPPRLRIHAGTALDALPNMAALIAGHPKSFDSQADAIAWQCVSLCLSLSPVFFAAVASSHPRGCWHRRIDAIDSQRPLAHDQ